MKAQLQRIQTTDQNQQLMQDSIQRALDQVRAYSPSKPAQWTTPAPTTVEGALDRIASLLVSLNGGNSIP